MKKDIDDVRGIAIKAGDPDKYECAIQQMLEYASKLDPSQFIGK